MTRLLAALLLASTVSGCAVHDYMVITGGPGSAALMKSDLSDCSWEAQKRYAKATQTPAHVLGVAVGGAIGGLVASQDAPNPDASASNINRNVEACMLRKGYSGHSSG